MEKLPKVSSMSKQTQRLLRGGGFDELVLCGESKVWCACCGVDSKATKGVGKGGGVVGPTSAPTGEITWIGMSAAECAL
jgi:hypothetical protein